MIKMLKGTHETVDFKSNVYFMLYDNNKCESYPTHWHVPLEIIMPIKNNYLVTCYDTPFDLKEGDILLIAPAVLHSMTAMPGQRLIIQLDISMLHLLKEFESILSLMSPYLLITPETTPSIYEKAQELIIEISNEYNMGELLSRASIYSKLIELIVLIGRNLTLTHPTLSHHLPKQKEYMERFLTICDYINTHYSENLTLDKVADLSGFSKYHFSRLFKEFTNVSFYKYVNQKRIENAEKLLLNSEHNITEIAIACGFNSVSSFIRMFKLITNCTPTEFKNMYFN